MALRLYVQVDEDVLVVRMNSKSVYNRISCCLYV